MGENPDRPKSNPLPLRPPDETMNPLSPCPAIATMASALIMTYLMRRRIAATSAPGRFDTIDGLRGYLAFFVFLHHAALWYFYLHTGFWRAIPSNLYTHFGESSVSMFFMITGFLFWTKLIDGRRRPINWLQLYVSRILRLLPLYIAMLAALFLLVAIVSDFSLNGTPRHVLAQVARWSTFTILGSPNLNGRPETELIAYMAWSLAYEWFFYLSLPICAWLFFRNRPPFPFLMASAFSLVALTFWHAEMPLLLPFCGGIATAFLIRWSALATWARRPIGSLLALLCLGAAVRISPTAYAFPPMLLLAVAFCIIACGNTLFGVLSLPVSRALGETTYSIYLLHGVVLFVGFRFVLGLEKAAALSPLEYWLFILLCAAALTVLCHVTYRIIEAPPMRAVPKVTAYLERQVKRFSKPA